MSDLPPKREASLQVAWGIAGLSGFLALLSMVLVLRPEPASIPPRVLRSTLAVPAPAGQLNHGRTFAAQVAVSPDGRFLVLVAGEGLWLRPLDSTAATSIPGTDGAGFPFWSPDNSAVGFFAHGKLKTVRVEDGQVTTVCAAPQGLGGSWGSDDTILFTPGPRTGVFRVTASGGEPEAVTTVDRRRHSTHRWPEYLPGEERFLYFAASHSDPRGSQNGIQVSSISGGSPRSVVASESKAVYSEGRLLFLRDGTLLAQPFDPVELAVEGDAVPLAEGVRYRGEDWAAMFAAARRDVLAYEIGAQDLSARLTWISRLGNEQAVLGEKGLFWDLRFSPQGDRLAVAMGSPQPGLFVYELEDEIRRPLASETTFNRAPVWSPDGERVAFAAMNEGGRLDMFVISARGAGRARLLALSELDQIPTSWSPDGRWLAFDQGPPGATEIWILPVNEDGPPKPFIQTPPWAGDGQFSPDGKWLLYTSRESGADQIYVTPFPGPGERWQLSASSWSSHGRWSASAGKVFFSSAQTMLMEVEVRGRKGGGLDVGMPKILFSYRPDNALFRGHNGFYDVVGDDERFLVAQGPERVRDQERIMLVVPWSAELSEGP